MFYLKHFFLQMKHSKVVGIFFIVLTVSFVTAVQNRSNLRKVFSLTNKTVSLPYFNALISSSVDLGTVARKMKRLPGVMGVKLKKSIDVNKHLGSLSAEIDSDVLKGLSNISYGSLTVQMKNSIQGRSQNLIREYLRRLVGVDSVSLSDVKTPRKIVLKKNDPFLVLNEYGEYIIIAFLTFLWIVSAWSLTTKLKNYSYLIEKFQRKTNVSLKIYATGTLALFLPAFAANFYYRASVGTWESLYVVTVLAITFLFVLGKQEFKRSV